MPQKLIPNHRTINSKQLLSDILRVNLLADHGGMWMDSTIYVTQDLPDWNLPFYTLKQDLPNDKSYFSLYRWSGFFQGGVKNKMNVRIHPIHTPKK